MSDNIPPTNPVDRQNELDRLSRLTQDAARGIGAWGDPVSLEAKLAEIIELATTIRSYANIEEAAMAELAARMPVEPCDDPRPGGVPVSHLHKLGYGK